MGCVCPKCKSNNIIPIMYGYPTHDAFEEAEKGNYDKALKYFEEAVARGDIRSVDLIIDIYREITDLLKNQENINLYWEYKLQMARKMQECGKILEDEMKRRGVPC